MITAAHQHEDTAIVINHQLLQLAKLSKETFLERVANVEAIRTRPTPISLLLGEKSQMGQLEVLHAAVQTGMLPRGMRGFQIGTEWVPFVVEMPRPLHEWLASHSLAEIKGQLVNWMAALHAAHCLRFQMWRTLLPEIRQWAGAHYSPYRVRQADELIAVWEREFDNTQHLVGPVTPGVLMNPFRDNERPFLDNADVLASYQFEVRVGYFRKDDWLFIVERSLPKLLTLYKDNISSGRWTREFVAKQLREIDSDKMDRLEADRGLWQAWRQKFSAGS
ncbi:hypothetical protein [Hymenobacter convexus]|uniref:hypothetical protein n=1 Tax=Hymenobacter sp. CA1UV-4 TaxID=3063782 RepID=UPI0027125C03|nr:hypothetical protein [Hymenobacter sp. CA1UV-4]MDO7854437.1 hypothetical protein [Hymenobacter sp. CA1UV-4]